MEKIERLMGRYSIIYKNIDFETMHKCETMYVLDRETKKRYAFTKEFLLDQLIIPWIDKKWKPIS